jgi:hypothetical protein
MCVNTDDVCEAFGDDRSRPAAAGAAEDPTAGRAGRQDRAGLEGGVVHRGPLRSQAPDIRRELRGGGPAVPHRGADLRALLLDDLGC